MFCPYCGNKVKNNKACCKKCGASMDGITLEMNQSIKNEGTVKQRKVVIAIGITTTLVLIITGIFIFLVSSGRVNKNYMESLLQGDYEDAKEYAKDNEDIKNEKIKEYLALADRLKEQNDYEEALRNYEIVLTETDEPEAIEGRRKCLFKIAANQYEDGNYEDALQSYEMILTEIDSEEALKGKVDCLLKIAGKHYESESYEKAIEYYEMAKTTDYTRVEVYIGEADAYLKMDKVREAMDRLKMGTVYGDNQVIEEQIEYIRKNTVVGRKMVYCDGHFSYWNQYEYDANGNLIKEWSGINEDTMDSCETYDEHGNKTEYLSYDSNGEVTYVEKYYYEYQMDEGLEIEKKYDKDSNRLLSRREIKCEDQNVIWIRDAQYDSAGNITRYDIYEYNEKGKEIGHCAQDGEWNLIFQDYCNKFDGNGNPIEINHLNKYGNLSYREVIEYNLHDDIVKDIVYYDDGSATRWREYEYEYDEKDRMTCRIEYNASRDVQKKDTYEYDEFGNVTEWADLSHAVVGFLGSTYVYNYQYHYIGEPLVSMVN